MQLIVILQSQLPPKIYNYDLYIDFVLIMVYLWYL